MTSLTLTLLKDAYAVCRLSPEAELPPQPPGTFALFVRAPDETTLVCPASETPDGAEADAGWRCFRIDQTFDFSVPGILASVLAPLAQAEIGIFATSTFSTDYVLVKARDVVPAIKALARAGHRVGTEQG